MKSIALLLLFAFGSAFAQIPASSRYEPLWPIQDRVAERQEALSQWLLQTQPIGEEWDVDWQLSAPIVLQRLTWILVEHRKPAPTDIRQNRILVYLDAKGRMQRIELR